MRLAPPLDSLDQIRLDIGRMGILVAKQLEMGLDAFQDSDSALASLVVDGDDLIDNLNLRVESYSYEVVANPQAEDGAKLAARASLKVAMNLERIGDCAVHIAKRVRMLYVDEVKPGNYNLTAFGALALQSIHDSVQAYLQEDLTLATRACEMEPELDRLYLEGLGYVKSSIGEAPATLGYCLHLLAVLKYLEKVGDYVLNIGEQGIYAITGRRLKFTQFQELDSLVGSAASGGSYRAYFDGISGASVARVDGDRPLLFKEGSQRKITEEVDKTEIWRKIDANIIPRVLSSVSLEDRRAFLREYVDGLLLSHLYFEEGDPQLQQEATRSLCESLGRVWHRSLTPEVPNMDYVQQIRERLENVYLFHPHLRHLAATAFPHLGQTILPLEAQLALLSPRQGKLAPQFSIWLHGDFNPNNVLFNREDRSVKFIDVHRSHLGDYLQDITVFLVGLQRDPNLSPSVRDQLTQVEATILAFIRCFAETLHDHQWEQRLLLGLGRSYITSARVILQPVHAEWLFQQGRITLQQLVDHA